MARLKCCGQAIGSHLECSFSSQSSVSNLLNTLDWRFLLHILSSTAVSQTDHYSPVILILALDVEFQSSSHDVWCCCHDEQTMLSSDTYRSSDQTWSRRFLPRLRTWGDDPLLHQQTSSSYDDLCCDAKRQHSDLWPQLISFIPQNVVRRRCHHCHPQG